MGKLLKKALTWIVPHIIDEIQKELEKRAARERLVQTGASRGTPPSV
jgi:hypothetical protein